MAFRASLVAFEENAGAFPYLGLPFTEVVIQQPDGADASNPGAIVLESRDSVLEATDGSDGLVVRRKITGVELDVDFVDFATKEALERLKHDGRSIYLCPNVGQQTRWSFPLQRSLLDFLGRKTVACTRASAAYVWDAADQVMRSWDDDEPALSFHGRWLRYLRTGESAANRATKPHPDSTSHGWTNFIGTAAMAYSESVLTPVLARRGITNGKGVLSVYCDGTLTAGIRHSNGTALSAGSPIGATLLICAQGAITVQLRDSAGGAIRDTVSFQGTGKWRLITLSHLNSGGATTAVVEVYFLSANGQKQAALVGPIFIGNCNNLERLNDWHDGTMAADSIAEADTVDHLLTNFTLSWMQMRVDAADQGVCAIGSTNVLEVQWTASDGIQVNSPGATSPVTFTAVSSMSGALVGDWTHFVLRGSQADGLELFVNGAAHSNNGAEMWEPADFGHELYIGRIRSVARALQRGGISHLRLDARAWSDKEVVDHYHTFFSDRGRGIVEPLFGKELHIESLEFEPRTGDGEIQWLARIDLRELGPTDGLAGMIRQEGDV